MNTLNNQILSQEITQPIHWGHFGIIIGTIVLLAGITWMKKPEMFSVSKTSSSSEIAQTDVPHYYPYVAPAPQPLVAGATTDAGPSVINEDGSISPVDFGQVLGASTQDINLSPEDIKVNSTVDSETGIKNYLLNVKKIEVGPIDSTEFKAALSSNDQNLINEQANKFISIRDDLQKLYVPKSLIKWHQLNVIQYNSAIGVLQNFTKADDNPTLVGKYLEEFIKSQQDIQTESVAVAEKFNLDPAQLSAGVLQVSKSDPSLVDPNFETQNSLNDNAQ